MAPLSDDGTAIEMHLGCLLPIGMPPTPIAVWPSIDKLALHSLRSVGMPPGKAPSFAAVLVVALALKLSVRIPGFPWSVTQLFFLHAEIREGDMPEVVSLDRGDSRSQERGFDVFKITFGEAAQFIHDLMAINVRGDAA
ncbi:MAG TPA: hypothetical protein VHK01_21740 [Lacipirellulaceae bacterium]|nr:hypothetical protein [Lacipirellulaceae bacterium]